jgi:BTB/POZ domain
MDNANATPSTVLTLRNGPTYGSTEELVTFHIGKDPSMETFKIHKEVACLYSPVLKAALNSQFIEGQTQTYTIDDTTKEVFQLLIQ